jgi:predicted CXXCH cytochrome family protein
MVTLGMAAVSYRWRSRPGWIWGLVIIMAGLSSMGAWAWDLWYHRTVREVQFTSQALPHAGRPDGYVSSDRCEACHPSQYQSWHRSFHRTMTQVASPESVRGRFDSANLEFGGKSFHLERRGNEFWAELDDPEWSIGSRANFSVENQASPIPRVTRRIGMLTGSHHMQVYWLPGRAGNLQSVFPFAYLLVDQRWVPLKDTFLKDPALPQNQNFWNLDCLKCHSTGGQPRPDPLTRALDTRVTELGIACEACHGPAEAHVIANKNPLRRYRAHWSGKGDPTIVNPARLPSKLASQVCGQCHGIKWIPDPQDFAQNGFRYRPGQDLNKTTPIVQPTRLADQPWLAEPLKRQPHFLSERYWPDGGVRVSGRDYNGLIESPCYQRGDLSCLSCHSMHQSDPNNQLATGMESNEACLQCHTKFRARVAEHTHHPATSSGSLCYNCHMPYTTYGLLKAIRSHQIESPSVRTSVRTGRPNGCNLCHLDRSLGWTDQHLTAWFGSKPALLSPDQQTVSAAVLWALRGDAGQRALVAWHLGWTPARQASGEKWLAPYLAHLLADPYSAVRYIAGHSLRTLPGFENLAYDYIGSVDDWLKAQESVLQRWRQTGASDRKSSEILIDAQGEVQRDRFARLAGQRDNRSMDLQE